jgi:signal transduction histidine kinase
VTHSRYRPYVLALVVLAIATLARQLLDPWVGDFIPFPFFLVAAAIVGLFGGLGAALLTVLAGGLVASWLFISPRGELAIESSAHSVGIVAFYIASTIIVILADRLRKSRARLNETTQQLEEAGRQKDEFISLLAHELRNPLAPIVNAVELIRMGNAAGDSRVQPALAIIDRQVQQLKRLIDDLMDVGRMTSGRLTVHREPVDLAGVIRQCMDGIRVRYETSGVHLAVTGLTGGVWVHGDRARLVQDISNLLDNAAKFTPRGGRVDVKVRREGDRHIVSIRDDGIGIAPQDIERLFEPFVQLDNGLNGDAGGLGLGLHLVRRLMAKHDGTVEVFSAGAGLGSEFVLRFPVATLLRN